MKKLVFVFLLFFVASPFQAAAGQWQLDTVHTNFYFDVKHTYATVRGQFKEFSGDVYFNPENVDNNRFDFVIKVDSVDTGVGKRDMHLRSPDFFDAVKYPLITFKSTRISRTADNKYSVAGTLTIKDVSRDVTLEFIYHGQKENPLKPGEIVAGLDTRLTIDRLEYHVGGGKFYNMGVVAKDVDILLTLELLREK
ncbi:MAG: YceI family protein [Desulfobulbales bacterium]|nr:YceI family protein [Desulfobulbales bacterium]